MPSTTGSIKASHERVVDVSILHEDEEDELTPTKNAEVANVDDSVKGDDDDETSSSGISSSSNELEIAEDEERDDEPQAFHASSSQSAAKLPQTADLRSRLTAFLPQIAQANKKLSTDVSDRVDDVAEDEEHYIEMNLGLGVLSEKSEQQDGHIRLEESSSSDDSSDITDEDTANEPPSSVMETLKGEKPRARKRKIEELG